MKPNKLSFTIFALIVPVLLVQALIFTFVDLSPNLPGIQYGRFVPWLMIAGGYTIAILTLHFYSNYWLRKHNYIRKS